MAALGNLDPLGMAAPILPKGGPSALEVAMGRNDKEDQYAMAALKAQQKAAETKAKDDAAKNTKLGELSKETVWVNHQLAGAQMYGDMIDWYKDKLRAYDEKRGENPDDPKTEAGAEWLKMQQGWRQAAKTSTDLGKQYDADISYIQAHEDEFMPGALNQLQKDYADPSHFINGTTIDRPYHLWDYEKNHKAAFEPMRYEMKAWANPNPDGSISEGSIERPVPGHIKKVAEAFATGEWAYKSGLDRIANLPPARQEWLKGFAEKQGMTLPAAFALDLANGLYDATRATASRKEPSAAGYGMARDQAAAVWFAEYLKGTQGGTYGTEVAMVDNPRSEDFLFTDEQPANAPGWWNRRQVPSNLRRDNTLNGFVWDEKTFYDSQADKNIRVPRDIKDVLIDPTTEKYLVKVAPAGEKWSKERGEVVVVPFDQAESKLGPAVLGLNPDRIGGITKYDVAAEREGYGQRKGTSGGNIVKTGAPKAGALNIKTGTTAGELD